ncbi:TPA: 50S ribosomal protein L29 [candidate division CPR2 bacterium]|uniref:Large ribosomal subunit protein uL29 n=1 Tax=candidate division CPR2 bacterium GW2011_GWC1_41_48 TaxID=1618344 RepID=A0A0G0W794_UNCC2|nr:MAG: 50S ribosomal protein L29 [candidate division CPR2 bacterium GW2011_GWC2_39_35]KKR27159.1 MAG: 50S ribosomal protein L29 [candidate division CPR2 bacterium GW2011_GWD2_39_7]KKR27396.1 MAG: 50S ribosomal protein L29 [candidate division CPR2 bacterium GW2011_GWD1_39_7]KKS08845.1 MAG: coiled-coil [candidate division CPR2 bacterium GW2011_GWC1_41_48]OGB58569.1 MAG: 50S ribosomal protein L29 [candidate division CPR2 bacterium GWD1_39_7]OGB70308.1 MAG: 50S ribosomal protein L29 [candidate di
MKYKELIQKNDKQLDKELNDLYKNLRDFRFGMVAREIKNVKAIKNVKKDIARILTLKKERDIAKSLEEEK